jgi:hypothetical protein
MDPPSRRIRAGIEYFSLSLLSLVIKALGLTRSLILYNTIKGNYVSESEYHSHYHYNGRHV